MMSGFVFWHFFLLSLELDLDVLKSFYRYVIVSLDFPLHTENVFRSLPSVFGWILGQEKPHFHIFVKWENLRTKKEMIFSHNLELNYWSCFYDTVSITLNTFKSSSQVSSRIQWIFKYVEVFGWNLLENVSCWNESVKCGVYFQKSNSQLSSM